MCSDIENPPDALDEVSRTSKGAKVAVFSVLIPPTVCQLFLVITIGGWFGLLLGLHLILVVWMAWKVVKG